MRYIAGKNTTSGAMSENRESMAATRDCIGGAHHRSNDFNDIRALRRANGICTDKAREFRNTKKAQFTC